MSKPIWKSIVERSKEFHSLTAPLAGRRRFEYLRERGWRQVGTKKKGQPNGNHICVLVPPVELQVELNVPKHLSLQEALKYQIWWDIRLAAEKQKNTVRVADDTPHPQ